MSHAALIKDESESGPALVASSPGTYRSADELERLVSGFENCTLPPSEFTHSAHVSVAFWYLYHYSGQEAAMRIREGIKRFNAAASAHVTPTVGYHETITLFWILTIGTYLLLEDRDLPVHELANRVVERYSDKGLLFRHYSRERLFSMEARSGWVEPDLRPLGQ